MVNSFRNHWKAWIALGILLLIAVMSVIFLSQPHTKIIYEPDASDIPGYSASNRHATVTVLYYQNRLYGAVHKEITGEVAQKLRFKIFSAASTGERAPKLADGEFPSVPIDAVPLGTVWLEIDDTLYRINEDRTQLCRVETHYGEGRILKPSEDLFELIDPVLTYWPSNCYSGIYCDGTLTLTHEYKVEPTVDVTVTDLEVGEADEKYQHYSITLRLYSKTYQMFQTSIESGGGDLFYTVDVNYMELRPGWAKTVTMEFQCPKNDSVCGVTIGVANTRIDLRIEQNSQ